MVIKYDNTIQRTNGKSQFINDIFVSSDKSFDIALCNLNGTDDEFVNELSDMYYFIKSGTGKIKIDDIEYEIKENDFIIIEKNKSSLISGNLTYLVISMPAFDINSETIIN